MPLAGHNIKRTWWAKRQVHRCSCGGQHCKLGVVWRQHKAVYPACNDFRMISVWRGAVLYDSYLRMLWIPEIL